jgi:hypothetical protein
VSNGLCLGAIVVFGQGQDSGTQRLHGFPLRVVECAGVQGIDQGQQLAAVGRRGRVLGAVEAALNLGHGPILVGGHRAVVQAGVAESGVDEFVTQGALHRQHRRPGVQEQRRTRMPELRYKAYPAPQKTGGA